MSDSREEFESIARASGFHDFEVSGNGCYSDDFLQHFYAGWAARGDSRQLLEGEPVAIVDRVGIMQRLSPYTNLDEGTKLYAHPASAVPKEWCDLMRELLSDFLTEVKTKQMYKPDQRVAENLGIVREAISLLEKQEQDNE